MTSPSTLLKAWNILARKELGQNFIKDPSIAGNIIDLADLAHDEVVLDIGAGLGAMTIAAARKARKVIAVEKDARIIPLLRAELLTHQLSNVEILQQNITALDLPALSHSQGQPLSVVGNLPYNISSQVLIKLIHSRAATRRAILMFQKELADRLCAGPGSRTYGRISVILQYCANIRVLRHVRADMFFPKPKVDSVVLAIDFKRDISDPVSDESVLEQVVQAAFGQRRKTLHNALPAGLAALDQQAGDRVLSEAGIDPQRRAETLSVPEFVALTRAVEGYLRV